MKDRGRIEKGAFVHKNARIGKGSVIASGARILDGVRLDENVQVESGTVIYGPAHVRAGTYIGPNALVGFPQESDLREQLKVKRRSEMRTVVGDHCIIRSGATIYCGVTLGKRVRTGHNTLVRENVTVGDDTLLGTNCIIDGSCMFGKHVSMQSGVYVCTYSQVEDYVFMGPCCVFTNDKYVMQRSAQLVGPTVRTEASIGANALLMAGVEVGRGAVVGAQALVTENVPARTIVVGMPATVRGKVPDDWKSLLREKCMKTGCHE